MQSRKISRLEREVNSLQGLLKSYDDEDAAAMQQQETSMSTNGVLSAASEQRSSSSGSKSPSTVSQLPIGAGVLSPRTKSTAARITMLEGQLAQAVREADELRKELAASISSEEAATLREELESVKKAHKDCLAEIDAYRAGQLQKSHPASGHSVSSRVADSVREPASGIPPLQSTRIVHMKLNPLREAIRTRIDRDKEAREAAASIAGGASGSNPAGSSGAAPDDSRRDDARDLDTSSTTAAQSAEASKLRERLVSQFQQRMMNFREVVWRVLGWKVWMEDSGKVAVFQS